MSTLKRALLIWLGSLGVLVASFRLPHEEVTLFSFLSYSLQLFLFILCVFMVRHEPARKNKVIFVNFALLFSLSVIFHLYNFAGLLFSSNASLMKFFAVQYVSYGAYFFLFAFAIVYLTVDVLFRDFKIVQKYLLAFAIVGGFFGYYYQGVLTNPRFLYTTEDIVDWKVLDRGVEAFKAEFSAVPSAEELAARIDLPAWSNGEKTGSLYPGEVLKRTKELYPYLSGMNYMTLLYKPLYKNTIYMCVLSLGFILLFFGYQYMKDPPQGAYIEKIMFLLLLFCSLEIFHAWSFMKSVEWETFFKTVGVSQYVSAMLLALLVVFFSMRLRFITSAKGEFYEQELVTSPYAVTRWRDAVDNLVIAHFFDKKNIFGQLFVDPEKRKMMRDTV